MEMVAKYFMEEMSGCQLALAAVAHSCVRGVSCDREGELLCPGGAGARQGVQGVGDGCELHRLLAAQR